MLHRRRAGTRRVQDHRMSRSHHRPRRYVGEKIWNAEQAAKRVSRTATAHAEEIEAAFADHEQRRLELVEARMLAAITDADITIAATQFLTGIEAACCDVHDELRKLGWNIGRAA